MSEARILILSVGAGSGHNRAAQALHKAFGQLPQVACVEWIDCLEYTSRPFRDLYSRQFLWLVRTAPALWAWAFEKTDVPWQQRHLRELLERLHTRALVRKILDFAPTACVCTHFTPAVIIARMLGRHTLATHLSIVVTDFYVHASWLTRRVCRYFVTHEENRIQLEAAGVPGDRISITGIPIDPVFENPPDRSGTRQSSGLREDRPVILLCAGTAGSGRPEAILRFLEAIRTPAQFVIVCGRNEKLKARLTQAVGRQTTGHDVRILGYTDRIHEWMAAADVYIGKPGGLSTAECLASGLPMVVWDPVPGQEIFNAGYLVEHGAGVVPSSGETLPWKVDRLLQNPGRLAAMKQAARSAGQPDAARRIARHVLAHIEEPAVSVGSDPAAHAADAPSL
jgi:processive 1,2-diacylglycerol beta-glucosyltransferase